MTKALAAFLSASTEAEVLEAYGAMLEWSDAPEGLEGDDIETMLNALGHPSLRDRLASVAA